MSKAVKPRKTAAQLKKGALQAQRLLILSDYYVDCWFVTKLESVLRVETTVINPVIECRDRDTINALIDTLYTVRADTYNVLGSVQFWNGSWFDAYVNTVVNTACKSATQKVVTIHVEYLLEQIRPNKKLSRRAKNRLEKWEKGTVKTRLTHWSQRNSTNLNWVNAAYSSQVDHRNGTLLGTRNGDCFTTYDRVEFQSDLNAAMNVLHRGLDTEITRFMKYKDVQVVLLRRTALFLSAMGLTLLDAINLGWLDVKHKKCQAFEEILHGL